MAITHIAVRPGEAGAAKKSGWECDGIYAYGASNILVRNCSITWATDEGLSASGKRFGLDNAATSVADWRAATSHDLFFLNNIVAEGLSNATHSKGEHSKGTLIHDNVRNALIADSSTKAHQINVETQEGVVQLSGFVDNAAAKSAATNVAKSVTGVKDVKNELSVKSY